MSRAPCVLLMFLLLSLVMVMVISKVQMALADLQDFVYQVGIQLLQVFILDLNLNIFGEDQSWCITSSSNAVVICNTVFKQS